MTQAIIYLVIALISYLGSRKAGLSKGKSALVAAGVTGVAYSQDVGGKIEDWFTGVDVPTDGTAVPVPPGASGGPGLGSLTDFINDNKTAIGVAGVTGVAAGLGGKVVKGVKDYWPWLLGGLAGYLILRGGD